MDLDHLDTPQQGTTRTDWALRLIARALKDIDTGQITLIGPSGNRVTLRGHLAGVDAV